MRKPHNFSEQEIQFIKDNVRGRSYKDLNKLVNDKFNLGLSFCQIKRMLSAHGLKNGLDGRFRPGHVPATKGTKGISRGGIETQFKPGHRPKNYRPIGSERVNIGGYIEIKVADPDKWQRKHVYLWEQEYGPLPKGYAVIFADKNKQNLLMDNLLLVSKRELAMLNKFNLLSEDADLTKAGLLVADIKLRMAEIKRKGQQ